MMDFVKNNWVLLLILAIVIYLVVKYYKSVNSKENNLITNAQKSVDSSVTKNITSDTGKVEITPPVVNTTQPINGAGYQTWQIGDKIYAGSTGANTYTVPNASQTTIARFYNKGEYIGTFLNNENGFTKIIAQNRSTNSLLEAFGWTDTAVVYSKTNQVYKK